MRWEIRVVSLWNIGSVRGVIGAIDEDLWARRLERRLPQSCLLQDINKTPEGGRGKL